MKDRGVMRQRLFCCEYDQRLSGLIDASVVIKCSVEPNEPEVKRTFESTGRPGQGRKRIGCHDGLDILEVVSALKMDFSKLTSGAGS